jgi:D-tyrosyl-tRNA(Tyr) deacylase
LIADRPPLFIVCYYRVRVKAVIQRVKEAAVSVNGKSAQGRSALGGEISKIGNGLLVLLGISEGDTGEQVRSLVSKVSNLRIFSDEGGKMNLSVKDISGELLIVSQFTLLADTSRGHRPSFVKAAKPERAEALYKLFIKELKELDIPIKTGEFGAYMRVSLVNDGPVTIVLESGE